ncbi:MAG: EamA family transporter [Desulforhopalus sp.]
MKSKHIALLIVVAGVWGGNFAVIQYGLEHVPPLALSAMRFFMAAFPACLLFPRPKVSLRRILTIGMTLGALMSGFQFAGMSFGVGVATSSVVLQSQSVFTTLMAVVLLGERPSRLMWSSTLIGVMGLACFWWNFKDSTVFIGFLMVVIAAFWWAVGNLIIKNTPVVNTVALMAWMSLVPIIPLGGLSFFFEGSPIETLLAVTNLKSLIAALYLGLGVMIFGYGVWSRMLQKYDASQVVPYSLLVPVFGVIFGVVFFDESVSTLQLIGAIFLVLAAALNSFQIRNISSVNEITKNHTRSEN